MHNQRWGSVSVSAACLLFATAALYAQSAATGDLQGTIVDATGAPVAGVRVSATNVATGMARTVTTSDLGRCVALVSKGLFAVLDTQLGN